MVTLLVYDNLIEVRRFSPLIMFCCSNIILLQVNEQRQIIADFTA